MSESHHLLVRVPYCYIYIYIKQEKSVFNTGETRRSNKNDTELNGETGCKCQIKSSTSYLRGASKPDSVLRLYPLFGLSNLYFFHELGGCVLWQNVRQLNSHGSLSWRWGPHSPAAVSQATEQMNDVAFFPPRLTNVAAKPKSGRGLSSAVRAQSTSEPGRVLLPLRG